MIRDASRGVLELHTESAEPARDRTGLLQNPIIAGAAVSISNPYWILWWATVGLMFFSALASNAFVIVGAFYLGHISGDIIWYMLVGGAVSTGRKLLSPKVYRAIIGVCGVFLIWLGATFLYLMASGKLWTIKMSMDWLRK
jgi:threonine/homoserine/homoserine lactone efflux protein